VLAVLAMLGSALSDATPARADEIVRFDRAGDAPEISLIGDSTLAGVRWYADYGELRAYDFVLSAESCRRTIEPSCVSREGFRSDNVLTAMRTLDGELGEVLVVMSGYNDPASTIGDAIAAVVEEAESQGVDRVVWLTLRTSSDVDYSDPQEQSSINTFRDYNEQLVDAAAASDGYLQVADWATYSNGASAWFETDGVHLTPAGVDAITGFIASIVQRVLAGEDVSPAAAPWTVLVPGATGDQVAAVQEALLAAGIDVPGGSDGVYGNDTMAAVADYQRRNGELQVTGAVDLPTARALGVFADPDDAGPAAATPSEVSADAPAAVAAEPADPDDAGPAGAAAEPAAAASSASVGAGSAPSPWLVAVALVSVIGLAVVARRRYVVAQRNARRRARVHPAASPHRSIADLRRSGALPPSGPVGEGAVTETGTAEASSSRRSG
jgi:peptidoglycan hydrolase-like protein with peptidoglycan-binding domain